MGQAQISMTIQAHKGFSSTPQKKNTDFVDNKNEFSWPKKKIDEFLQPDCKVKSFFNLKENRTEKGLKSLKKMRRKESTRKSHGFEGIIKISSFLFPFYYLRYRIMEKVSLSLYINIKLEKIINGCE